MAVWGIISNMKSSKSGRRYLLKGISITKMAIDSLRERDRDCSAAFQCLIHRKGDHGVGDKQSPRLAGGHRHPCPPYSSHPAQLSLGGTWLWQCCPSTQAGTHQPVPSGDPAWGQGGWQVAEPPQLDPHPGTPGVSQSQTPPGASGVPTCVPRLSRAMG